MAKSSTTVPQVLQDFYAAALSQEGIAVAVLQSLICKVCDATRMAAEIDKRRTSQEPWKKFIDEICPVSRFLTYRGIVTGHVRFPLNDQAPDAWYSAGDGAEELGIEATIALGGQRYVLMQHLNEHGEGPGFIVENDDDFSALKRCAAEQHKMYSTEQALDTFKAGIIERLRAKNTCTYAGFVLVIGAPLDETLPQERWNAIVDDLRQEASPLPFSEVHVVDTGSGTPYGLQLK